MLQCLPDHIIHPSLRGTEKFKVPFCVTNQYKRSTCVRHEIAFRNHGKRPVGEDLRAIPKRVYPRHVGSFGRAPTSQGCCDSEREEHSCFSPDTWLLQNWLQKTGLPEDEAGSEWSVT